jgi:DNA-binding response OmpR family regulator
VKLLLVEDDPSVADFLQRGLRAEGYAVVTARTGTEALEMASGDELDLIVLDRMLPGLQGLEVCQRLRASGYKAPILMLTALASIEDKVEGLNVGADDYLAKPFAFQELLARITALLRRPSQYRERPRQLAVADLALDRQTLTVQRGGRSIELTAKELALLELLMRTPGRVLSRTRILDAVWGNATDPLTNVVDVYISRLRTKIDGGAEQRLIRTVRGYGYKIVDDPSGEVDPE